MAFVPISGIVPQVTENGNQANGMVLKFYEPGTLTPLAVGIDSTGATLTTEFLISIEGYTTLSGNEEIPHVDQIYKIVLYLDQADADANDTGSAVYVIDDIDLDADIQVQIDSIILDIEDLESSVRGISLINELARPVDINDIGNVYDTSELNTGSGSGSGKYELVNVDPGFPLINRQKTDGSLFWLKLFRGNYSPTIAGAIPNDLSRDDTDEVQEWLDWSASESITDCGLWGQFTTYLLRMDATHSGINLHSGGLYSTATRALSNQPNLLIDDTASDLSNIHINNIIFTGRAQYTGNVAADDIANNASNHNGSGLSVLGKVAGRARNIFVDNCHFESLGNSGLQTDSVDNLIVGDISGRHVVKHVFGATVTFGGFGAIGTWPSDFQPFVSVDSISADECGTLFDLSTVGDSKTDDTGQYRPIANIGKATGTDISFRTKIHGNWNADIGQIVGINSSFSIQQNDAGYGVLDITNTVVRRVNVKSIYAEKFPLALRLEAGGVGIITIGEVYAKDCLACVDRLWEGTKIGKITSEGCFSILASAGTTVDQATIGEMTFIDSDRQFWLDNKPSNWAAPASNPIIISNVTNINVNTFNSSNIGSSSGSNYAFVWTLFQDQTVTISSIICKDVATVSPDGFFLANGVDNCKFIFGKVEAEAVTAFEFIKMNVNGDFSNYLFIQNSEIAGTIRDEFDGTLSQSGPGLYTWTNVLDYRGKATLPVLKTDGASLGTIGA